MSTITQTDIANAKDNEAAKRAICAQVAANLQESNPSQRFAYNDAGVYLLHDGVVALVYSWTLFGTFVRCNHALNVTEYVKESELSIAA